MCGFVTCVFDNVPKHENDHNIEEMNQFITHRGPDQVDYIKGDHIELGFSRLSIIDIEGGDQPLSYEDGRYWIVFNGEIYNYLELRKELVEKGKSFKTKSDTEVILALYSEEGKSMVHRLRGMFAFVIWDNLTKTVFAARDRFGIKPLFYVEKKGCLMLASEKKSLLAACDNGNISLNEEALQHYLSFQYVPEPGTMAEKIMKVETGYYLEKTMGQAMSLTQYWKPTFTPIYQSEESWVKSIQECVIDSVRAHMRSDVPVGAFLSGGIDSTIIAAIAKEFKPDLETFSIGFETNGYSEIAVAKATADHLNLVNHSSLITADEYISHLPRIMWHMDDPLADPACVPLYFVAREASKRVKVVLSGEGADELFGGYNIYREPQSLAFFRYVPALLKRNVKTMAKYLPDGVRGKSFLERGTTPLEERYIGNAKIFSEMEKSQLLRRYDSQLSNQAVTKPFYRESAGQDLVNQMQHLDICTWLRGDILVKADRMTMAHSLELRVPFLDSHVFELASHIPSEWKTTNGTTKYILRKAFKDMVPDHVYMRKKLGFPVPLRHWLKDELYDWAIALIDESETDEYLNKSSIRHLLDEHSRNKADHSRKIWTALTFMVWHQVYIEQKYSIKEWLTDTKIQKEWKARESTMAPHVARPL